MFKDLPESVKARIVEYLIKDDFSEAKRIYDDWKGRQLMFDSSSEREEI